MMCPLLGVKDARAMQYASQLGMAMQITNICRDVAEDAERGRVYLPASRLAGVGLTAAQILDGSAPRCALRGVISGLLSRADTLYRSAEAGLRFLPPRARLAVLLAGRLYRGIGVELLRRGADPFSGRAVVPLRYKAWWILAAFAAWVRIGLGLARTFHPAEAGRSRAG
jgi:phytoene synthase